MPNMSATTCRRTPWASILASQLHEDLVGHVRQWRPHAVDRRQLREQHRGLPHDAVHQELQVHAPTVASSPNPA
jgi:hypothetical protein